MVTRNEYKGHPMLELHNEGNSKYPFSFGLSKAKLIVENIEEIKKFVDENKE